MKYMIAAYSDIGSCKPTNQDSLCLRRAADGRGGEILLAAVCDGMGGLEKGELASAEMICAIEDWFDSNVNRLPELCAKDFAAVRRQLTELVEREHRRLLHYAGQQKIRLGTTLTALLAVDSRYLTIQVGDSRLYALKGSLTQLTQDQSLVAVELSRGRITPAQAKHHPQRNVLLQCLGAGAAVVPVYTEGTVQSGVLYFLCSDGFVHELAEEEICTALEPLKLVSKQVLSETLIALTEQIKARGETDNITILAIKAAESACESQKSATGLRSALRRRLAAKNNVDSAADTEGISLLETGKLVHTEERLK